MYFDTYEKKDEIKSFYQKNRYEDELTDYVESWCSASKPIWKHVTDEFSLSDDDFLILDKDNLYKLIEYLITKVTDIKFGKIMYSFKTGEDDEEFISSPCDGVEIQYVDEHVYTRLYNEYEEVVVLNNMESWDYYTYVDMLKVLLKMYHEHNFDEEYLLFCASY